MKRLIILSTRTLYYGSNASLKLLIENSDEKVDLIVDKNEAGTGKRGLKEYFGENINKVYEFELPKERCFELSDMKMQEKILYDCNNIHMRFKKKELYAFIEEKQYTHIHLNGLWLYPLLNQKYNMTIHVRELFYGNMARKLEIQKYLRKARGVIYIDNATKEAINNYGINSIILNNPFDQRNVRNINVTDVKKKYGIGNQTVFLMAGSITKIKGVEKVIKAFLKCGILENGILLIAGTSIENDEYGIRCKELMKENPNIKMLGMVKEMDELYRIADYIIRGESQFCIGRTIYEGLCSGCEVIIPGSSSDLKYIKGKKFMDKIHFYAPDNIEELSRVLQLCIGRKMNNREYFTNIKGYVRRFEKFVGSLDG